MENVDNRLKLIIFSAPSGSGKTTLIHRLLERFDCLEFSISATSRPPRGVERDGVDYYFLSCDEFRRRVAAGDFVEWEEVYAGTCYGTLRAELERIAARGHVVLFDVDVKGGLRLKEIFAERAMSIFVMPPSIDELRRRLIGRGTDAPETIEKRLAKAADEISCADGFDRVVMNDSLDRAAEEVYGLVASFLQQ